METPKTPKKSTSSTKSAPPPSEPWEVIKTQVERYRSEHLTEEQSERFGPRMRELVLHAEPQSRVDARAMLGALGVFLSAMDGPVQLSLDELLTEDTLARWANSPKTKGYRTRTLTNHKGRLDRLVRVLAGLPSRMRKFHTDRTPPPGFSAVEIDALLEGCIASGPHAVRGLAAAFYSGEPTRFGGRFVEQDGQWRLDYPSGEHRLVLPMVAGLRASIGDGVVRDGDWDSMRRVAVSLGMFVDRQLANQTYRSLVLQLAQPMQIVVPSYRLSITAIDGVIPHLGTVEITSPDVLGLLRGNADSACAPSASAHVAARPPSSGGPQEHRVKRNGKSSRATTKKALAAINEAAKTVPELTAVQSKFLGTYRPDVLTPEAFELVHEVFLEAIARAEVKSEASLKKHSGVLAGYLGWRLAGHRPLNLTDAFTFAEIDLYCLHELTEMEATTRNDYRSRLRGIAKKVNPGLDSPISASAGHVPVRFGYTRTEEAAIRRVTLRQRKPEARRRLCAIVGLGGGGGLDAVDLKHQSVDGILDGGEAGIIVIVSGPRPRTTVIRREYEQLVRIGIEGLKPGSTVLPTGKSSTNPTALAINNADLFDDTPDVDIARLRSTWIAWLMSEAIPLRVILTAAGLRSARTLVDLLPHLPSLDTDLGLLRDGGAK